MGVACWVAMEAPCPSAGSPPPPTLSASRGTPPHTVTELLGLEGTSGDHRIQPFCQSSVMAKEVLLRGTGNLMINICVELEFYNGIVDPLIWFNFQSLNYAYIFLVINWKKNAMF